MIITVVNRQRRLAVDPGVLRELAELLMQRAAAMNPRIRWLGLTVVLVGHRAMAAWNEAALGHEGTTDVITMRYRSLPGEARGWRGEIILNTEQANDEGANRPGGVARELALYLAHGCQHLSGADDASPAERRAMSVRQNRWLRSPAVARLIPHLLRNR